MSDDVTNAAMGGVGVGLAIGVVCGVWLAAAIDDHPTRQAVVEHGAAHWEVKPDGSTEFKWNAEAKDTDHAR